MLHPNFLHMLIIMKEPSRNLIQTAPASTIRLLRIHNLRFHDLVWINQPIIMRRNEPELPVPDYIHEGTKWYAMMNARLLLWLLKIYSTSGTKYSPKHLQRDWSCSCSTWQEPMRPKILHLDPGDCFRHTFDSSSTVAWKQNLYFPEYDIPVASNQHLNANRGQS